MGNHHHPLPPGAPPTQHDLSEGVHVQLYASVLERQPDERHRARFLSAAGQHAGAWLGVIPITPIRRVRTPVYRTALRQRLGAPLGFLGHACGGCGLDYDDFGFHVGVCGRGNRGGAWSHRSAALEDSLVSACRSIGQRAQSAHGRNWFGAAGLRHHDPARPHKQYRRADVVLPHFHAPASHLFIDAAITDPCSASALSATPSSSVQSGCAAQMKEVAKFRKYQPICDSLGASFFPAAIERYGACGSSLVGLVRMLCGDGDRDIVQCEGVVFSAASRVTFFAQQIVFAAVIADAEMVLSFLEQDVHARDII